MGKNADRWKDMEARLDSIDGLNRYNAPVDGQDVKTPFVLIKLDEVRNIIQTSQKCSVFDGIYVNIKIGVSTKRDDNTARSNSTVELLDLFDQVQSVLMLNTQGSNARAFGTVTEEDVETSSIEYSGFYR